MGVGHIGDVQGGDGRQQKSATGCIVWLEGWIALDCIDIRRGRHLSRNAREHQAGRRDKHEREWC